MSHELKIITREVNSVYCGSDALSASITENWSGDNIDLSNMTYSNADFIFNLKNDNWSNIIDLELQLRWESAADSGYLVVNFSDSNFLNYFSNVNSENWTGFRIPVDEFTFTDVTSFDVSSLSYLSIEATVATSDTLFTMEVDDIFFEFGGSIVEDQARYSLVNSGGGNAVEFMPEFDYEPDTKKIQSDQRLWNGDHFTFKFGEFDVIKFTNNFFPNSAANAVNSLWLNNVPSIFISVNSYSVSICDVKLMGSSLPFKKFQKPYIDLLTGKVHMESYD